MKNTIRRRVMPWTAAWIAALALAIPLTACGGGVSKGGIVRNGEKSPPPESSTISGGTPDADSTSGTFGITIRQILEANRTEALVSNRGSFLMETDYAPEIDATGQLSVIYADGDAVYLETDDAHQLYTGRGFYLYTDGYYGAVLTFDPLTRSDFSSILLDEDTTSLETITAVDRKEDTLTVHTTLSAEAVERFFGEELESIAYLKGDSTESDYTLDAEDLAILSCVTALHHADGTVQNVGTMTVTYGGELPENGVILREHQEAAEQRTVTIVLDPDTEEETRYSTTVQRGDTVFPYVPEGYFFLYQDPACTEEYEGTLELEEDLILYSRAIDLPEMLGDAAHDHDHEEYDAESYDSEIHAHDIYDREVDGETP